MSTGLLVLRIGMILLGLLLLGRWITGSVGGYIDTGYLLGSLGLLVGAYGVSYLE